jgi:hypothetical protein
MKILDRAYQAVSVTPALDGTRLEVRVHGDKPQGDSVAHLSPQEARVLAYGLLAEAERMRSG